MEIGNTSATTWHGAGYELNKAGDIIMTFDMVDGDASVTARVRPAQVMINSYQSLVSAIQADFLELLRNIYAKDVGEEAATKWMDGIVRQLPAWTMSQESVVPDS